MARLAQLGGRGREAATPGSGAVGTARKRERSTSGIRWSRAVVAASLGLIAFLPYSAEAQGYPSVHVVAFAQRADRAAVEPGGVFVVTIHVKIAQRRDRLDELILGSFENCEIISNETVRTALPDGTDFVERLTVQALQPGEATISPAYIDAIDPALRKPMRFSSNALRVHVTGASPIATTLHAFAETARRLLLAAAIVAGLFAAVFVLVVVFVRRKRRPAKIAPAPVPVTPPILVAVPVSASDDGLMRAAQAYRRDRSVEALAQVRGVLFGLAGVASGATLVDALRALGERDAHLRAALVAAEDAAFGPASEREAAGDLMLAAIDAYGARGAAHSDARIG